MPWNRTRSGLGCGVALLALAGVMPGVAQAAGDGPAGRLLPPMSLATATYFHQHPQAYAAYIGSFPVQDETAAGSGSRFLAASGGSWTALPQAAGSLCNPLLLHDGRVLVHSCNTAKWLLLSPDAKGDYATGSWSDAASMPVIGGTQYAPQYNASAVLPDGRVLVMGGEYNGTSNGVWTNLGAIYDPAANSWTAVAPPAGSSWALIGDAQASVLDDGTLMLGSCCASPAANALFQPATLGWVTTGAPQGGNYQDEQGYVKLQNGRVLTTDIWSNGYPAPDTHAELYQPTTGAWTYTASTPMSLADPCGTAELGPAVARADGSVVAFGGYSGCATGSIDPSALYNSRTALWSTGPTIPVVCGRAGISACDLADAPAAYMRTGSILFAASSGFGDVPTHFFEMNASNQIVQVSDPVSNSTTRGSYTYNFMCLPNGQVLMTDITRTAEVYSPVGRSLALAAPSISSVASTLSAGRSYFLAGSQLHGVSEGAYYGDDDQSATNYPIVRITNNATGHAVYAPTGGYTTMSIARHRASRASFAVPAGVEAGASSLVVIANGVASAPVSVTVN